MSVLAEILSSRIRAEVFRILFGVRDLELHGRELARQSGFNEAATRQELRKLERLETVSTTGHIENTHSIPKFTDWC